MADSDTHPAAPTQTAKGSRLQSRIIVGGFLIALAVGDIYAGGPAFDLLVAIAVLLIFWEWSGMHDLPQRWTWSGLGVLAVACLLASLDRPLPALGLIAVASVVLAALSWMATRERGAGKRWITTGLLYAGVPAVALIWMRDQPDGFALVMWSMTLVWATDICAYVAGRSIGGPRIAPAISPNKTWAGLLGGMAGAAAVSIIASFLLDWRASPLLYGLLGAGLAVVSQAGDFFESWLKRRAGVKDSGTLLRGHGGVMDRLDGLLPVVCVVAGFVAWTNQ